MKRPAWVRGQPATPQGWQQRVQRKLLGWTHFTSIDRSNHVCTNCHVCQEVDSTTWRMVSSVCILGSGRLPNFTRPQRATYIDSWDAAALWRNENYMSYSYGGKSSRKNCLSVTVTVAVGDSGVRRRSPTESSRLQSCWISCAELVQLHLRLIS